MAALDPVVARARAAVRDSLADLDPGSRVVIGLSGGADSLALAAVSFFVAARATFDLEAVVVDHGLQDGSGEVAATAAEQARGLGLRARVVQVEVGTFGGPEAAARDARYQALLAGPPDALLLAHTLDDQAETVLLGLGRGSGSRSISGMRPAIGRVRRPFLGLTRADTEQICRAHDLTWWDDPHNASSAFRRSRLRHEVMPVLDEVLGGGVAAALARTADQLRDDSDLLDALAADVFTADTRALAALHPALRSRVLRRLALDGGARPDELAAHHLAEIDRLVTDWSGQLRVELPGAVCVRRVDGRLLIEPTPPAVD